jgi:LEA14-like dessication related protein
MKMRIAIPGLLCLLLSGCAHLSHAVKEPEVLLTTLELNRFGLSEQSFTARLSVRNPNDFRLPVRSFTWAVSVEGVPLAHGVSDRAFGIPAGATEEVSLQFGTDLLTTARGLIEWLRSPGETLDYRIEGEFRADLPFAREIPFNREGRVKLTGG